MMSFSLTSSQQVRNKSVWTSRVNFILYFLTEAPKFGLQCEDTGDFFGVTFNCTLDEEVTSLQCFVDGQPITDCKFNTCSFTTRKPVCRDDTKRDGAEAPPSPPYLLSLDKQEWWWSLISLKEACEDNILFSVQKVEECRDGKIYYTLTTKGCQV